MSTRSLHVFSEVYTYTYIDNKVQTFEDTSESQSEREPLIFQDYNGMTENYERFLRQVYLN